MALGQAHSQLDTRMCMHGHIIWSSLFHHLCAHEPAAQLIISKVYCNVGDPRIFPIIKELQDSDALWGLVGGV